MPISLKTTISAGSSPLGSYATGKLAHDTNYLACNGNRYLVSAYPDVSALTSSGQLVTNYELSNSVINAIPPAYSTTQPMGWLVDDNKIFFAQRNINESYIAARSTDNGATWVPIIRKSEIVAFMSVPLTNEILVHDFIKVAANSYCALVTNGASSVTPYVISTTDNWDTFTVVRALLPIVTGSPSWNSSPGRRPRFIPGGTANTFLIVHQTPTDPAVWLTTNSGVSFSSVNTSPTTWKLSSLVFAESDGTTLFFANSTALYHTPFPTTTTVPEFTTVAGKFGVTTDRIKKLSNRYVAWSANANPTVMQTSTTLTGTYTSTTWTGISSVSDIIEVGSTWFMYASVTATSRANLCKTTDAVSPAIPTERSFVSPAACPDFAIAETNGRFPVRYGTALSNAYFIHSAYDIASTTDGLTFTALYRQTPRTTNGMIKKYGYYFAETPANSDQNLYNSPADFALINTGGNRILYRSTDLITWEPLFGVRSGVLDLGTRLYVLVGTGSTATPTALQTTDGITWNTTGITQPTILANSSYAKAFVCNGKLFRYSSTTSSSQNSFHVSQDQGATWTTVPLSTGYQPADDTSLATSSYTNYGQMAFFKEKYYHISSVRNSTDGYWHYRLAVSADLATWTYPLATSGIWTALGTQTVTTRQRGPIAVVIGNYLYIHTGTSGMPGNFTNILRSSDGISFEIYTDKTTYPDQISQLVADSANFVTENGLDSYFVVRGANPTSANYKIYKNGTELSNPIAGTLLKPGVQAIDEIDRIVTISGSEIGVHPKANVSFTTPVVASPAETFIKVKQ